MTVLALLVVVLLVVGAASLALLEVLVKRADVAAAMVLASVPVQALFVGNEPALHLPSGTTVYVTDMVAASIFAAALARILRLKRFDRFQQ